MRQLLLCKWERDAPDAGPAHCTLQYTRPCGRVKCSLWLGVTFVNPCKYIRLAVQRHSWQTCTAKRKISVPAEQTSVLHRTKVSNIEQTALRGLR